MNDATRHGGDLLISGGTLVTREGRRIGDVLIRSGLVERIGTGLDAPPDVRRLDASGLLVFPGMIDPQVHFREPGMEQKEDLESGSRAAVAGGVTTFFEMPNTNPPTSDPAALEDKLSRAAGRAHADHAFFLGATSENADLLGEWEAHQGCAGVKLFMGASTGNLLVPDDANVERVLRSGKRRVTVHSEDDVRLKERYAALSPAATVMDHADVRDVECAVRSTTRLLNLVEKTGRPVHVLHVSTAEELEIIRERDLGDLVTCEATPNHLFLAAPECYEQHGTWAQMNPPVRDRRHQDALRAALKDGPITCIGSDHAPHTAEEKAKAFPKSPSGIAGVQTTLPLLLTAVRDGWLTESDILRLCIDGPIRVYGLLGKGALDVGKDGDVALVDPRITAPIAMDWLQSRAGGNPFVGVQTAGLPVTSVVRGQVVWSDGRPASQAVGRPVRFAV
ncbi:MAG: dihydroorotase [Planctomycetes bacterium]|nr:dihydroorotase [Planctomycetota bacterium]